MKVISNLGRRNLKLPTPFLAIGVFDGVHKGHQGLIRKIVGRAKTDRGTSVVMTFHPHPVHVLHPKVFCPLLVSLKHRLKLIEQLGVDVCIVIHFTKQFSHLTPQEFIEEYLVHKIKPKEIFVGDDFRFGQDRSGDLDLFKKRGKQFGFKVTIVAPIKEKNVVISSTRIRQLIAVGELDQASQLLGRTVSVLGKVLHGVSRGRTLGFPTANIQPECEVLPPQGVYFVSVNLDDQRYLGLANIGVRPTFDDENKDILIETYILDFNGKLYGKDLIIEFHKKLRDEKKFSSKHDLAAQIKMDVLEARAFFKSSLFA